MKYFRFMIFISLLGLVSVACSLPALIQQNIEGPAATATVETVTPAKTVPAPTVDPIAAAKSCLAGTWEMADLSDYLLAAIPPEMAEQYDLQYQGTNGKAYFTLSPDGRITLQAEQLELLFEARASIFTVPVTVSVDGEAVGKYTVDGDTLITSEMDTSGLTASAQAMGNELISSTQIINAIPLIQSPFNTAQYTCTGDRLQLKLASYPESVPPLEFNRVKQ